MQDQGEETDGVRRTELSSPIRDSSVQAGGLRGPQHEHRRGPAHERQPLHQEEEHRVVPHLRDTVRSARQISFQTRGFGGSGSLLQVSCVEKNI